MRLLVSLLLCAAAAAPVAAQPAPIPLIPLPREVARGTRVPLANGIAIVHVVNAEDSFTAHDLFDAFTERRIRADTAAVPGRFRIELLRLGTARATQVLRDHRMTFDSAMTAEGYLLLADSSTAHIIGASAKGVFYGAQTLKQLVTGAGTAAVLQGATIRDWPAMKYRGFHDDLSRGPIPTLAW